MSIFAFLFAGSALLIEGHLLLRCTGMRRDDVLSWTLGYPVGVLLNALLFFSLHLLHIPFSVPL